MMTSLHRCLAQQPGVHEHAFYTHSLQLLTIISGEQADTNNWTVTLYEVEFKKKIGYGGLYARHTRHHFDSEPIDLHIFISGEVYEGICNKTRVALKVLRSEDGVTPSLDVSQVIYVMYSD
jgi:hypothetical protein